MVSNWIALDITHLGYENGVLHDQNKTLPDK